MLNPSGVLSYGKTYKGCVTMEFSHSFLSFRHFLISRLVWMFKFALAGQGREVANYLNNPSSSKIGQAEELY